MNVTFRAAPGISGIDTKMIGREMVTSAYLLPATTVERIRGVVDSGRRLPEKSTYFWPKPRTGMVFRLAY